MSPKEDKVFIEPKEAEAEEQMEEQDQAEQPESKEKDKKDSLSQDDINRIVAARVSREVDKIKRELEERQRLKDMPDKERLEYEAEQAKKRADELEARLRRRDLEAEAMARLQDYGLSAETNIVNLLVQEDEDQTREAVNRLALWVEDAISKALKGQARQNPPTTGWEKPEEKSKSLKDLAREHRVIK